MERKVGIFVALLLIISHTAALDKSVSRCNFKVTMRSATELAALESSELAVLIVSRHLLSVQKLSISLMTSVLCLLIAKNTFRKTLRERIVCLWNQYAITLST